jgi:hypothetical protein
MVCTAADIQNAIVGSYGGAGMDVWRLFESMEQMKPSYRNTPF